MLASQDFGMTIVRRLAPPTVPLTLLLVNKNVTFRAVSVRTDARTIRTVTRACSLVIRTAMTTEQMRPYWQTVCIVKH